MTPTPAQSDETQDAELAKQWIDSESPYIAHDTVKQLLAAERQRIFAAMEGALSDIYAEDASDMTEQLRAAIKRLREEI